TKGPTGIVSGRMRDSVTGDPIIGGVVEVVDGKYKTKTDGEGEYTLKLPPGIYEIRLRSDTSQPIRVANVEVREGETVEIKRELQPLEGAGQVLEVAAEMNRESEGARLEQRKKSISARDLMSRDEISKSGGGSTSAVARRIVGSTVVGGRFLFVRGLGHRYGNTLFDGARVPSPEPELRTVPLDIFPSGALSAINIQKTFTPDVPADFTGGSTQLESRDVPEEFIFEVSAELGANTATTGRQMVTGAGFTGADAFGFGNIPRGIPSALPNDFPVGPSVVENLSPRWTVEETERFGESLLSDTRVRRSARAPLNFGFKATTGYGREYGSNGGKIGFLASAAYKSKHSTTREQIRQYGLGEDGGLDTSAPNVDFNGLRTVYNVSWSGIGLVKWKLNKDHRLELLGFYSRDADDETRSLSGDARSVNPDPVINTRLRYVTRSVLLTRLGGKHKFPKAKDLEIDWFGSYAQAQRDDPSMRDMVFTTDSAGEVFVLDVTNGGGKQLFLDLVDNTESGALNFTLPFKQWGRLDSKFKAGVWLEGKQRQFFARRFAVGEVTGADTPVGTGDILGPENVGGGRNSPQPLFYRETTRSNDNYEAEQEIYATYAQIDLPLVRWLKVAGGARFEASLIDVNPFDLFARNRGEPDIDETQTASLADYDVLPSVSVIFSPTQKMNIRLVGTQTLARPEFRELAPFEFTDFVGGSTVIGNPALVSSKIWNADLRWEFFPSVAEVVALSVFYKYFDEPIERTAGPRIPRLVSFRNAKLAHNVGIELEARKNLEFIGDAFENFSLGANFAYIYSRVELGAACNPATDPTCDTSVPDVSTSRERTLQGQSPFVVNTYLDYTAERTGTSGRLLYNAFGRRIFEVGGLGLPDTYEEAVHNFDFVLGQEVYDGLTLSFGIENILNYPLRFTQGPARDITHLWWPGTTFTLGLSYEI
ncbi:MAG: outer membrane beta-barrel protein, partial [Deltaproteobacteria bacterium]|nr:outer membrane beta-barrel protein [Deltaproteobacteria bacterium]